MSCETAKKIAVTSEGTVFALIGLGIIINTTVCAVMLRNKCVLKNMSNFFIFHLSLTDLIFRVLTVGPLIYLSTVYTTKESETPCKLLHFFSSACAAAFFFSLVVISVDVFRDAAYPLKGVMSRRTPFIVVFIAWFYAAICSAPLIYSAQSLLYTELPEVARNITGELRNCSVPKLCDLYRNWSGQLSTTLYFVMAFLAPIVVKAILFLLTVVVVTRSQKESVLSSTNAASKVRVTRMLCVLSLGVMLCWGPTVVVSMLRSYDALASLPPDSVVIVAITVELLKFVNSLFNPLIFACFIPNFRKDLTAFCCKCCLSDQAEKPQFKAKAIVSTDFRDSQTMM